MHTIDPHGCEHRFFHFIGIHLFIWYGSKRKANIRLCVTRSKARQPIYGFCAVLYFVALCVCLCVHVHKYPFWRSQNEENVWLCVFFINTNNLFILVLFSNISTSGWMEQSMPFRFRKNPSGFRCTSWSHIELISSRQYEIHFLFVSFLISSNHKQD